MPEPRASAPETTVGSDVSACGATCPVQRAAVALDGKWTLLVLRDLLGGTRRYSELQRSLKGISPRLLTARLRALEAQGLLTRTAHATVPPTTEYALSDAGRQILPVIEAMAMFGSGLLARDAVLSQAPPFAAARPGTTRVRNGRRMD